LRVAEEHLAADRRSVVTEVVRDRQSLPRRTRQSGQASFSSVSVSASPTADLLLMGQATASANLRDLVEPYDLPITKGFQENIHKFRKMDDDIELSPILDRLATYPPLDRMPSEETETRLAEIVGGLGVALARIIKIVGPEVKNPQSQHWEHAIRIFDELM
jgi:hypothetical protein